MTEKWMPQVAPVVPADAPQIVTTIALEPETIDATRLVADVEEWMKTAARPSAPVLWCPRGQVEATIGGVDQLAAKVATLAEEGAWAVVKRTHGWTWTQTMRVDGGWIVEVNGIPGPDCFARRVHSTGRRKGWMLRRHTDLVTTAAEAGAIMWSWMRGSLPEGYELKEVAA